MSIIEAEKILKENGLETDIKQEENKEIEIEKEKAMVKDQMPVPGVKVNQGSKIEIRI